MNKPLNLLFALLLSIVTLAQDKTLVKQDLQKPQGNHRKAILIGNNKYTTQPKLYNCERDVDSMAAVFGNLGFAVNALKNLNRQQMIDALKTFYSTLQDTDTACVYFSGHGVGVIDESFLLPVDIQLCEIKKDQLYLPLRLSDIINKVLARNVKNAIFLLDACRNMPDLKPCGKNLQIQRGIITPIQNPPGFIVAYATGEDDTASDRKYDSFNSLFTAETIKYLPLPNMGIRQILDKTRIGVVTRSANKQDPHRADRLFGDIVLNPQIITPVATNTLPQVAEMPCADWEMEQTDVVLRAVGEGRSPQQGIAHNIARNNAQANIARNLRSTLDLVAERYFMQNDENNKTDWKELNTEVSNITTTMDMANMTVKCQKCQLSGNNTYTCWVGLEVLAKDVVAKFDEKLPKGLSKKLKYDSAGFKKTFTDEWNRIKVNFSKP